MTMKDGCTESEQAERGCRGTDTEKKESSRHVSEAVKESREVSNSTPAQEALGNGSQTMTANRHIPHASRTVALLPPFPAGMQTLRAGEALSRARLSRSATVLL